MPLLNYTTEVDVSKSVAEIQVILIQGGATDITCSYHDGKIVGIGFQMATPFGKQFFRLPAKVDGVQKVLQHQHAAQKGKPSRNHKLERRHTTVDHAERVAWRIVKDWLEAQMAMVHAGQAVMDEVMLPYMLAGSKAQTMYQYVVEHKLGLPKPEK